MKKTPRPERVEKRRNRTREEAAFDTAFQAMVEKRRGAIVGDEDKDKDDEQDWDFESSGVSRRAEPPREAMVEKWIDRLYVSLG